MKRPLAAWITILFLFQILAPTWVLAQDGTRFEVLIDARTLNVRSGPGTDFQVLASVKEGDQVVGLRQDSGWVQVELPDGTIGWVSEKYVKIGETLASPDAQSAPPSTPAPPRQTTPSTPAPERSSGSGGGVGFGGVFKWTMFLGAAALGGLAYNEKTQGDDAYDEYEELALAGDADAAAEKWDETADHDDKAQLYAIVAGSMFGVFLLQQFVFTGGGDSASHESGTQLPTYLAWNPASGELRANLVQIRF